ncbi:MAG: hypothetical protein A2V90_00480 [Gammaproteobacteria bacterium RBG_16_57_12]|nr:MAG: hypothetical protein A2V90_00480 [Gammaproteobacteria bacterium RBG_16_57_12]
MSVIVIQPTSTALWHQLVLEAEQLSHSRLDTDTESYLVFMLMRYLGKPEMTSKVVAMDYLNGLLSSGDVRDDKLRDVGDTCLLFSGLFPLRAQRRRVKISYYVDMGRSAYLQLSDHHGNSLSRLYLQLSEDFVTMMDILHAIRAMGHQQPLGDALTAAELWHDTGSHSAYRSVIAHTGAMPGTISTQKTH